METYENGESDFRPTEKPTLEEVIRDLDAHEGGGGTGKPQQSGPDGRSQKRMGHGEDSGNLGTRTPRSRCDFTSSLAAKVHGTCLRK